MKQAMSHFTVNDLIQQTEGVECRKDEGVLDEIPGYYKDIDVVMENQKDLVRPVTYTQAGDLYQGVMYGKGSNKEVGRNAERRALSISVSRIC